MAKARFSTDTPTSVAGLAEVWASVDACMGRGNPSGAVFQMMQTTRAAPELGLAGADAGEYLSGQPLSFDCPRPLHRRGSICRSDGVP